MFRPFYKLLFLINAWLYVLVHADPSEDSRNNAAYRRYVMGLNRAPGSTDYARRLRFIGSEPTPEPYTHYGKSGNVLQPPPRTRPVGSSRKRISHVKTIDNNNAGRKRVTHRRTDNNDDDDDGDDKFWFRPSPPGTNSGRPSTGSRPGGAPGRQTWLPSGPTPREGPGNRLVRPPRRKVDGAHFEKVIGIADQFGLGDILRTVDEVKKLGRHVMSGNLVKTITGEGDTVSGAGSPLGGLLGGLTGAHGAAGPLIPEPAVKAITEGNHQNLFEIFMKKLTGNFVTRKPKPQPGPAVVDKWGHGHGVIRPKPEILEVKNSKNLTIDEETGTNSTSQNGTEGSGGVIGITGGGNATESFGGDDDDDDDDEEWAPIDWNKEIYGNKTVEKPEQKPKSETSEELSEFEKWAAKEVDWEKFDWDDVLHPK